MTQKITQLAELVRHAGIPPHPAPPEAGRNAFTRALDRLLLAVRRHLPALHWTGAFLFGLTMFLYAWIVGKTCRLVTTGAIRWPDLPERSVLAIWHGNAPALMAALAKSKPRSPVTIMIATEPRGDALLFLCRMLGLRVIRGDWEHHGWSAVIRLAEVIAAGSCAIITPDGGAPRRRARSGALVLAAAAGAPLLPIGAECRPAFAEPNKWDKPRNPLPFGRIAISIQQAQALKEFRSAAEVESARLLLEQSLEDARRDSREALGLSADE